MPTPRQMATDVLSRSRVLQAATIRLATPLATKSRLANVALAVVHRAQGDTERAIAAYQQAGSFTNKQSSYDLMVIKLLLQENEPARASSVLCNLARRRSSLAWFDDLADAVTTFTRYRAHEQAEAAAELLQREPATAEAAGFIYYYCGNQGQAQRLLEETTWGTHRLRASRSFRTLSHAMRGSSHSGKSASLSLADLFAQVPASISDYREADLKRPITVLELLQQRKVDGILQRRMSERVFLFAEPGAALPATLLNEDRSYTLFANGESQARQAHETGISVLSLREQVPDQSPIIDTLYAHAKKLAESLIDELLPDPSRYGVSRVVHAHRATLELLLEDRIAAELVELEWLLAAIKSTPKNADFLMVAADGEKILQYLPWLLAHIEPERLYLQAPDSSLSAGVEFSLAASAVALNKGWRSGLSRRFLGATRAHEQNGTRLYNQWISTFKPRIEAIARQDAAQVETSGIVLLANLLDRNYADGNCELATSLQKNHNTLVLSTTTTQADIWSQAQARGELNNVALRSLPAMCQEEVDRGAGYEAGAQMVLQLVQNGGLKALGYHGRSGDNLLLGPLLKWARFDLPLGLIETFYLEQLFKAAKPNALLVSPGRARAARVAAQIAREAGVRSIDLQMVNTPGYRKYKTPITDIVTAIDDVAEELLVNYFKVDANKVHLVGSPKLDVFRRRVASIGATQVLADLNLSTEPGATVCFASQMQPIEQCVAIVRAIAEAVHQASSARLIIKLHPREDSARQQAYSKVLEHYADPSRFVLARDTDMNDIYAATDVLVTMYSNAAREALVLGKRVLIANFSDKPWPMRFDLPGLAVGAYSPATLTELVASACEEIRSDIRSLEATSDDYIHRNRHLVDTTACAAVDTLIPDHQNQADREVS